MIKAALNCVEIEPESEDRLRYVEKEACLLGEMEQMCTGIR